jgi:hypothetical protein
MSSYVDVCPGQSVVPTPTNQVGCRTGDEDPVIATGCPEGTVVRALMTMPIGPQGQFRALCVPTSVSPSSSAEISTAPQTIPPQCPQLTDLGEVDFSRASLGSYKLNCYSGTGSPPPAPRPPFATLDTDYKQRVAAYDTAIASSVEQNDPSRMSELRTLSEGIQATLTKMIEDLTYLKKETPDIAKERDGLLETLRRIQRDYGAMLSSTDDLETLRRIRQQENGEAQRLLMMYLLAFLFVSMLLVVYLLYSGRKADTAITSAPTPTMSPTLT